MHLLPVVRPHFDCISRLETFHRERLDLDQGIVFRPENSLEIGLDRDPFSLGAGPKFSLEWRTNSDAHNPQFYACDLFRLCEVLLLFRGDNQLAVFNP